MHNLTPIEEEVLSLLPPYLPHGLKIAVLTKLGILQAPKPTSGALKSNVVYLRKQQ
jgi:hypothetical protein